MKFKAGLLALLLAAPCAAAEFPYQKELLKGLDLYNQEHILESLATFDEVIAQDPSSPIGHFFKAAISSQVMIDYETNVFEDVFNASIEKALELAEAWSRDKTNPERKTLGLFFLAGAHGYRGVRRSEADDWWGAFKDGGRAFDLFQEVLKRDPNFQDAYYGTGMYRYWKTVKGKKVWFFGAFVKDERELGIAELWKAVEHGVLTDSEGRSALNKIYHNEKNYAKVIELTGEYLKRFPSDVNSLFYREESQLALKDWDGAKETLETHLKVLSSAPFPTEKAQERVRRNLARIEEERLKKKDPEVPHE